MEERKAGPVPKIDFQSEFNPSIADQPLVSRQAPQIDFAAISSPPSAESFPTIHPDNLPSIPRKHFLFPITGQVQNTIRNVGDFVEKFHELQIPDENQVLSSLVKTLLDDRVELSEQLAILKQIKKDKKRPDRSVAIYLQEKRILKTISASSTKTAGVITTLDQLFNLNIDSINQSTQLDIHINDQSGQAVVQDTLTNGLAIQREKTKQYPRAIDLLIQNQARIKVSEAIIGDYLQQQEQQIYKEYYSKALAVNSIVTKPPFDKVFAEIMAVIESQQSSDNSENSPSETAQTSQPLSPEKILAFHNFSIEVPTHYPDYQIASYYLTKISDYINQYTSNQNETYLPPLISGGNFEKVFNLTQKLLNKINPELRSNWSPILDRLSNIKRLISEQEAWRQKLGNDDIDMPPISNLINPEILENAKRLGLELLITPDLRKYVKEKDLKRLSVTEFLDNIKKQLPGWQNLEPWFWQSVKDEKIDFPDVSGHCLLVETMPKPQYGEKYKPSKITDELGLEDRFNVSWNDANKRISEAKGNILSSAGLPVIGGQVRMLEAVEWNLLANREGWGKTNTFEWINTEYRGDGASRRIIVGSSSRGGAARALWFSPECSLDGLGFRLAVVL